MNSRAREKASPVISAAICLALFIGVWLTRAVAPAAFVTWDEPAWVFRSVHFLRALSQGDLAGTLLTGHPGVLTMWSGALSLAWHRYVAGSVSQAQLDAIAALPAFEVHDAAALRQLAALLPAAKAGVALLHAAIAVALYLLLRRLLGGRYALVAALFLALDPYYLALSRVMHIDALPAGLMLVAALAALVYGGEARRRCLALSAVAAGLAALTKSYGLFAGAFVAVALAAGRLRGEAGLNPRGWLSALRRCLPGLLRDGALWALVAAATFVVLWPAMWVTPLGALRGMLGLSFEYAGDPGDATSTFFLGRHVDYPGLSFYPLAMFLRTTPLVLMGCALAVLALVAGRRGHRTPAPRRAMAAVLGYGLLYIAAISLSRKKYDRYMLPALLAADVVAAVGWVAGLEMLLAALGLRSEGLRGARQVASGALALLLVAVQAVLLLWPLSPAHYLAYYNPWAGGPRRAATLLPIGFGEGVEQAAAYLAARPGAAELRVATMAVAGMAPFFPGEVVTLSEATVLDSDYVLLYLGDVQSQSKLAMRYYGVQMPEYTVTLNGVEYAWLFANDPFGGVIEELARLAGPHDAIVLNAPSSFGRHYTGDLPWRVAGGASEAEVAAQLQAAAANAQHVFYVELDDGNRLPRDLLRRQLAQNAVLLAEKPFAHGTLRHYRLVPGHRFHHVQAEVSTALDFGQELRLLGYGLSAERLEPGQALGLAVNWRALRPIARDYQIFIHLVDGRGKKWAVGDAGLQDSALARSSAWPEATDHLCNYCITAPPDTPPGQYWLLVGVYDLADMARLPVSDPDVTENAFRIGPVEVVGAP